MAVPKQDRTAARTVTDLERKYKLGARNSNGEKGEKGEKGDPGPQGPAGKTPVKGTDYFTEADKVSIVAAILAELPINLIVDSVIASLPDASEVSY